MTPERWHKAKEIFQTAIDRLPGERSAFLASACDGDEALRAEVESLIVAHEKDGSFITEQIAAGLSAAHAIDPLHKAKRLCGLS